MTRRLILIVAICLVCAAPTVLAKHTVAYCSGGETGFWMVVRNLDQTVSLFLTRRDNSLEREDVLCVVRNDQYLRAVAIEKPPQHAQAH